ncbi:hypothetical protein DUI87_09192 [Hirundo rustica rustica]|uniref:Uncharacterized protein n=1 Tax=Hirundo rustica rustica TaxID=333673 RepID=A0A3M0KM36_HIRRU|nr:hypothetical protein DUI87_09192 [Hirundo rustica rustica]
MEKLMCGVAKSQTTKSQAQTIGESEMPSVLNQLLPMIKSYNERTKDDYACEDFLVLLIYIYSVVGEIKCGKELDTAEEKVKKALVKAICDEPEPSPLLQKITGWLSFRVFVRFGLNWKEQSKGNGPVEDSLPMAKGLELEGSFQLKSFCDPLILWSVGIAIVD